MDSEKEKDTADSASSAIAIGLYWANQVISVSLEFIVFLVIGYYIDRYFSSSPWGLLVFLAIGMVEMFVRLLKIAKEAGQSTMDGKKDKSASSSKTK